MQISHAPVSTYSQNIQFQCFIHAIKKALLPIQVFRLFFLHYYTSYYVLARSYLRISIDNYISNVSFSRDVQLVPNSRCWIALQIRLPFAVSAWHKYCLTALFNIFRSPSLIGIWWTNLFLFQKQTELMPPARDSRSKVWCTTLPLSLGTKWCVPPPLF